MEEILAKILRKHNIPSLAAAVSLDFPAKCSAAAGGVRKFGSGVLATKDDKYHIGSCTKAMTATIVALAIQEQLIRWDSTLGELFPECLGEMHPANKQTTIRQLLSHTAGMPPSLKTDPLGKESRNWKGSLSEQRFLLSSQLIKRAPRTPPGTKYEYSNLGYTIIAVVLERAYNEGWESLIAGKIFEPLAMSSAGFGAPDREGDISQPWGHHWANQWVPIDPQSPYSDNSPLIAPAGGVHCSMADLCKFGLLHLGVGNSGLLTEETLEQLHTAPVGSNYALGWIVTLRQWAGGKAFMHGGCNTMFTTVFWLAPARKLAVAVATNSGTDASKAACNEAAEVIIGQSLEAV